MYSVHFKSSNNCSYSLRILHILCIITKSNYGTHMTLDARCFTSIFSWLHEADRHSSQYNLVYFWLHVWLRSWFSGWRLVPLFSDLKNTIYALIFDQKHGAPEWGHYAFFHTTPFRKKWEYCLGEKAPGQASLEQQYRSLCKAEIDFTWGTVCVSRFSNWINGGT